MSTPSPLRFYSLKTCSTCRKAKKYLIAHGQEVEELPIRDTPPSREELSQWMTSDNLRQYMNTSSKDYRERGLSKMQLSKEDVLDLVGEVPNLLKRPLVVWPDGATFGFKEAIYDERLAAQS